MMRLDGFLSKAGGLSRKDASEAVRRGRVTVNGVQANNAAAKVDEQKDTVLLDGKMLVYKEFTYIMLNKPMGYVSSTDDPSGPTVLELLPPEQRKDLFPCGRLDKNTTGLLILTDNGKLAHRLLSPKSHVKKTYLFTVERPVTAEDIENLEKGVDIGICTTAPCKVVMNSQTEGEITLTEGKYHEIKLMFKNRCNKVLSLMRISFGKITLDPTLLPGTFRTLTESEELALETHNTPEQ